MVHNIFRMWLLATALLVPATVRAAGEEYSRRAADLELTVDSRWAGCGHGGYYPIRIKATNRGEERLFTFEFIGQSYPAMPAVRRSILLSPNATALVTLSVPCVGNGSYGTFQVYQNGRLIKSHSTTLGISASQDYSPPRPSLLIISPSSVDASAFETAVGSISHSASTHSYSGYYGTVSEDHQVVGPELLPESWIDYSGLDLVAVSLKTLKGLTVEQRSAILKWVHCGGTLIVSEVGEPARQSEELARLLEFHQDAAAGREWKPADPADRRTIRIVETDEYGNIVGYSTEGGGFIPAQEESEEQAEATPETIEFLWPESEDAYSGRRLLMGYVYAFAENPFPGTPHDWAWFLKSIPQERRTWTARHGISARQGNDEFLKFLIPSVKGVPVVAFLLLITAFTVVIGPLNYLWLWKKRRLYLLVITIPAIAMGTSFALFGYSAIAHGFSTKSRARSFTLLDQRSNTAVSMNREALYAGLAPSELNFSPETAVYPIWPETGEFDSGAVDWTDRQTLSGWLRSRTRTQFLTVAHRDERGRLQVSPASDGRVHIENGLEWDLEALIVCDAAGDLYFGEAIDAGASTELIPLTDEKRSEFVDLLKQHPLVAPHTSGNASGFFDWNYRVTYMYGGTVPVRYDANLMERQIKSLQTLATSTGGLEPQTYAAVVGENPGIEFGIEKSRPEASLHVLFGYY